MTHPTQLLNALTELPPVGSFATSGERLPNRARPRLKPNLKLDWPFTKDDYQALMARATPAPYGHGERTVLNSQVRDAMQIDASELEYDEDWERQIDDIVAQAMQGLGVEGRVRAQAHKVLIYRRGGHFKPHRDSEKIEGMFATLIVALPTTFRGGRLVVSHEHEERAFSMQTEAGSLISWAAFYADCIHELEPITSGHRVVITYNLIMAKGSPIPSATPTPSYGPLSELLTQYATSSEEVDPLLYLLSHRYTAQALETQQLKGSDLTHVSALRAAAHHVGWHARLATVSVVAWGSLGGDYEDYDDSGELIDAIDTHELTPSDYSVSLEHVFSTQGQLELYHEPTLINPRALDHITPDDQSFEAYMGNEGNSFERSYRVAGLVLWDTSHTYD